MSWYLPLVQLSHKVVSVPADVNVPAPQVVQLNPSLLKAPFEQLAQFERPSVGATVLRGHCWHVVAMLKESVY